MYQHHGHRSSAIRVLVGGALAATLGAASAAWACTPQAGLDINEVSRSDAPLARQVEVVVTHSEPPLDGEIVIAAGNVLVDAEVTPLATRTVIRGQRVELRKVVNLTVPGYHYYSSWMTDGANVIASSVRTRVYQVQPTPTPVPTPTPAPVPVPSPPVAQLAPTPLNPLAAPTGPVSNARPAPGAVASPEAPPVERSERSQAPIPPGAPVAPRPVVVGAPTAAVAPAGQAVRQPASADASPAVSTRSLGFQAPDASSLWSGLEPSMAPSLLGGQATEAGRGSLTVGSGLLAVGLLSLAGVAAVAGRQRLAVARPSRRS